MDGWRRVTVLGNGGSGKSTVAATLGARLGLPVTHLDQLYWNPGWAPSSTSEFRARLEPVAAADRWVIDGNYGSTFDLRLPRADAIVLLDLPRRVTIPSALARWLRWRGRTRVDMATGCPERMSREFLVYMWRYPARHRPALLAAIRAAGADDRLVRLRSRRAVRRWLEQLG